MEPGSGSAASRPVTADTPAVAPTATSGVFKGLDSTRIYGIIGLALIGALVIALFAGVLGSRGAEDFGFVGTPDQIIEQMRPFVALGVRQFNLDSVDFPQVRGLNLLINEVLPALRG